MIELKNVSKYYHDKPVLKNINLVLPKKGLIFIIGVSGSGKTTLLNLIGGLEPPTNGTINVQGLKLHQLSARELEQYRRYYVSFIFQQYNLLPKMSVQDNINLFNYQNIDNSVYEQLGLKVLPHQKVATLSGGERQRVAIARALASHHEIILADEPTGALDSKTSENIMNIFKRLAQHKLVIVVTHNEPLAYQYGDDVLKMVDGTLISHRRKTKTGKIVSLPKYQFLPFHKLIKIVMTNYLNKLKRNIIVSIALSIGLLSLLLVLTLSQGFKSSLQKYEYDYTAYYPLYFSPTSRAPQDELAQIFANENYDKKKVIVENSEHINNLDSRFMSFIRELKTDTTYQVYFYYIGDSPLLAVPKNAEASFYDTLEVLAGKYPSKRDEVLLLVDKNNHLSRLVAASIGLDLESYDVENLLNYAFSLNNITYKVTGIVKGGDSSYFGETSAVVYKIDNLSNEIPQEIYLFPKDYHHKETIIQKVHDYDSNFEFIDYTNTFKEVFTTLIDAINGVLIVFSVISLLVATMLMGIISYLNINEQRHDIGILKSLGISYGEIKFIFLLENIIIAIVSSLIAILLTILLTWPLNVLLKSYIGFENILAFKVVNAGIIIVISVLLTIVGSHIPIKHIDKLNIVSLLKNNN